MNIERNNKPILFLLILGFILINTAVFVYADTQYISDKLIVTMRQGMGNEYKIVKMLKTGTTVEVIEETDKYYKVQTEDGQEGWVLKQYITTDIPKPIIISGFKKEIEKLKNALETLNKKRDALKKELTSSKSIHKGKIKKLEKSINKKNDEINSLTKQLQKMTYKYNKLVENSGNVTKIISECNMLNEENSKLRTENSSLLQENKRLSKRETILWFLAGGGVFLFGWIAGKLSRKRKSGIKGL
ncbi:MAG: TIGR04211 family SH3 domain-containing protein [Thermodesulfobacteriota bacterium]